MCTQVRHQTHIFTCLHRHTPVCTHTCRHTHMNAHTSIHTIAHICMCVYTCVHIGTHTHTPQPMKNNRWWFEILFLIKIRKEKHEFFLESQSKLNIWTVSKLLRKHNSCESLLLLKLFISTMCQAWQYYDPYFVGE